MHNITDCFEHFERLNFKINPINSRNKSIFYLPPDNSINMLYTPANVLMPAGNSIKTVNLFNITLFNIVKYFMELTIFLFYLNNMY